MRADNPITNPIGVLVPAIKDFSGIYCIRKSFRTLCYLLHRNKQYLYLLLSINAENQYLLGWLPAK
jgi:hypothetical protein